MSKQESEQRQIEKPNIPTVELLIPSRRTITRRNFILGAGALFAGAVVFGERAAARRQSEVLQVIQNPIEFDFAGNHYMWDFSNAFSGIYPPNDPNRNIGTIRVAINGVWDQSKNFQPLVNETLYPEILLGPGVNVPVGGMAVNTQLDKYYLSTSTGRNDAYYDPRFEIGTGILTPDQYTDRHVFKKGLPQGGQIGLNTSSYITLGVDTNGNYLNMIFTDCIDSTENGVYQIRLDSQGNVIGDIFIKQPDQPTPTATATKTPSENSPTPTRVLIKNYIPLTWK